MSDSLELTQILNKLNDLEQKIDLLYKKPAGVPLTWNDTQSDSGIQISGGPTTIPRSGTLLAAIPLPIGPGQIAISYVVRRDGDGQVMILDAGACAVKA